ncbi:MAG TPA: hypothetical protein VJA27_01655 [Patescibacteria group bacterium]|nr:hypothetical protein [Patescibacteria group bacterium]
MRDHETGRPAAGKLERRGPFLVCEFEQDSLSAESAKKVAEAIYQIIKPGTVWFDNAGLKQKATMTKDGQAGSPGFDLFIPSNMPEELLDQVLTSINRTGLVSVTRQVSC